MSTVVSSSSHLFTVRAVTWRRQHTLLLVALGLVFGFGAVFILSRERGSSAEPTLYAVEGKLLVNGEPAANVNVAFHSLDGEKNKFCPVGLTDSKGTFYLTTRSNADGAPAGEYSVTFFWPDGPIDECECPDPNLHDRFKGLYANPENLLYQVKVNPTSNSFKFKAWRPRDEAPVR